MTASKLSVCVLISGSGTNLQALIDTNRKPTSSFEIVQVISNVPGVQGLRRAKVAGLACQVVDHSCFDQRDAFDCAVGESIRENSPDLVVLAGFMRILGPAALAGLSGNIINLHPSLLPLYRGTDTYARALLAGDGEHGASIHFVTEQLDGGPVISQVRIPILEGDEPVSLAARAAPEEHRADHRNR